MWFYCIPSLWVLCNVTSYKIISFYVTVIVVWMCAVFSLTSFVWWKSASLNSLDDTFVVHSEYICARRNKKTTHRLYPVYRQTVSIAYIPIEVAIFCRSWNAFKINWSNIMKNDSINNKTIPDDANTESQTSVSERTKYEYIINHQSHTGISSISSIIWMRDVNWKLWQEEKWTKKQNNRNNEKETHNIK